MEEPGRRATRAEGDFEPGEEIDLLAYARFIWRRRWVILAVTMACAAVGFLSASLRRPVYPATARLLVPLAKAEAGTAALTFPAFKALVESPSLAAKVVTEYHLDRDMDLDAAALLAQIGIEAIRDTDVVVVNVQLADPGVAAKVANRVGEAAVEVARTFGEDQERKALQELEAQMRAARAGLERAGDELDRLKAEPRDGRVRAETRGLRGVQAEYFVAEDVFVDAARRVAERRIRLTGRRDVARVIDRAVATRNALPRHGRRNAVVAGVAGLTLSLLGVLLFESIAGMRRSRRGSSAGVS